MKMSHLIRLTTAELKLFSLICHDYKNNHRGDKESLLPIMEMEKHLVAQTQGAYKPDTTYDYSDTDKARSKLIASIAAAVDKYYKNIREMDLYKAKERHEGLVAKLKGIDIQPASTGDYAYSIDNLGTEFLHAVATFRDTGSTFKAMISYESLPLHILEQINNVITSYK